MAIRTGTGGFIQFAGVSGASITGTPAAPKMVITRWALDTPISEADVSGFQLVDNIEQTIPANGRIGGSFEGFLDDTNLFNDADFLDPEVPAALITLQYNRTAATGADVAQQVSFQGWLMSASPAARPRDPNGIRGTFMGTGPPTWAKATLS